MRRSTIYGKNVRGLLRKFGHAKKISEAYDIAFAHQTLGMDMVLQKKTRVAFQGEPRAFSEAAAFQLLSDSITTVRSSVDNPENFTSFVLLVSENQATAQAAPNAHIKCPSPCVSRI